MGGDEIVAEWLGNVTSSRVISSAAIQRFCNGSMRFHSITFVNDDQNNDLVYLGKYYSNTTEFTDKAFLLSYKESYKFEFIDLYQMACKQYYSPITLKWIGVNQY